MAAQFRYPRIGVETDTVAEPSGDPIEALTDEDCAWLVEHGWNPHAWPEPRLIDWGEYK